MLVEWVAGSTYDKDQVADVSVRTDDRTLVNVFFRDGSSSVVDASRSRPNETTLLTSLMKRIRIPEGTADEQADAQAVHNYIVSILLVVTARNPKGQVLARVEYPVDPNQAKPPPAWDGFREPDFNAECPKDAALVNWPGGSDEGVVGVPIDALLYHIQTVAYSTNTNDRTVPPEDKQLATQFVFHVMLDEAATDTPPTTPAMVVTKEQPSNRYDDVIFEAQLALDPVNAFGKAQCDDGSTQSLGRIGQLEKYLLGRLRRLDKSQQITHLFGNEFQILPTNSLCEDGFQPGFGPILYPPNASREQRKQLVTHLPFAQPLLWVSPDGSLSRYSDLGSIEMDTVMSRCFESEDRQKDVSEMARHLYEARSYLSRLNLNLAYRELSASILRGRFEAAAAEQGAPAEQGEEEKDPRPDAYTKEVWTQYLKDVTEIFSQTIALLRNKEMWRAWYACAAARISADADKPALERALRRLTTEGIHPTAWDTAQQAVTAIRELLASDPYSKPASSDSLGSQFEHELARGLNPSLKRPYGEHGLSPTNPAYLPSYSPTSPI